MATEQLLADLAAIKDRQLEPSEALALRIEAIVRDYVRQQQLSERMVAAGIAALLADSMAPADAVRAIWAAMIAAQ